MALRNALGIPSGPGAFQEAIEARILNTSSVVGGGRGERGLGCVAWGMSERSAAGTGGKNLMAKSSALAGCVVAVWLVSGSWSVGMRGSSGGRWLQILPHLAIHHRVWGSSFSWWVQLWNWWRFSCFMAFFLALDAVFRLLESAPDLLSLLSSCTRSSISGVHQVQAFCPWSLEEQGTVSLAILSSFHCRYWAYWSICAVDVKSNGQSRIELAAWIAG